MGSRKSDTQILAHHKLLGEGLSSRVYKAFRQVTPTGPKQTVAIKQFKAQSELQVLESRFQELVPVRSRFCPALLGLENGEFGVLLIMDFIDGISLRDLMRAAPVPPDIYKEIIAQLQNGVRELHSYGIFHGDLSLSNIMVDRRGQVKLIDFGLGQTESKNKEVVGTPRYLSPERWQGGPVSRASDIFAVGLVALDLLTHDIGKNDSLNDLRVRASALGPEDGVWFQAESVRDWDPGFTESSQGREDLAELVVTVLDGQASDRRTQRISAAGEGINHAYKETNFQIQPRILAALALVLGLVFPSGPRNLRAAHQLGRLEVRTLNWMGIELDGRDLGFTPIRQVPVPSGWHQLRWKNGKGQAGKKRFLIKEGQVRLLTDQDFKISDN